MDKLKYILGVGLFSSAIYFASKYFKRKSKTILLEIGGTGIKALIVPNTANLKDLIDEEPNIIHQTTGDNPTLTFSTLFTALRDKYGDSLNSISAIKVVSFGPLVINKKSENYGLIKNSPKAGWQGVNLDDELRKHIHNCPITVNTDVNAAVSFEKSVGDHKVDSLAYMTVGTGVGIGVFINGETISGLLHTEGGHMYVRRLPSDKLEGVCRLHGDCLEGLASNHALARRAKLNSVHDIPALADEEQWNIIAHYLAQACVNLLYCLSVEKIVIGGGLINRKGLLEKVREEFVELNKNYVSHDKLVDAKEYIVRTEFENMTGLISAAYLNI